MTQNICEPREIRTRSLTSSTDYNSDTATTPYILDEFAYCMYTLPPFMGPLLAPRARC